MPRQEQRCSLVRDFKQYLETLGGELWDDKKTRHIIPTLSNIFWLLVGGSDSKLRFPVPLGRKQDKAKLLGNQMQLLQKCYLNKHTISKSNCSAQGQLQKSSGACTQQVNSEPWYKTSYGTIVAVQNNGMVVRIELPNQTDSELTNNYSTNNADRRCHNIQGQHPTNSSCDIARRVCLTQLNRN